MIIDEIMNLIPYLIEKCPLLDYYKENYRMMARNLITERYEFEDYPYTKEDIENRLKVHLNAKKDFEKYACDFLDLIEQLDEELREYIGREYYE